MSTPVGTDAPVRSISAVGSGVPLISSGEVIGLYSMDKAEVGFFTEEHARLAEMLAAHGAVAIEHARLLRDLRASNRQLQGLVAEHEQVRKAEHEQRVLAEALRDIAAVLTSSLSLDQVFEGILNQVARVVPFDASSILFIKGETVEVAHVRGFEPVDHRPAVSAAATELAEDRGNRAAGGD